MKRRLDGGSTCVLANVLAVLTIGLSGCVPAPNDAISAADRRAASLAIRGATLLDPGTGEVKQASCLILSGDRIIAAGTVNEIEIPEGVEVIEAAGLYVIPGL